MIETVVRGEDWDEPSTLHKAIVRLSRNTGSRWQASVHGNHADLWVHRRRITKGMSIAEARSFVEGMIIVI